MKKHKKTISKYLRRTVRGSVTVFLALILLPVLTVAGITVDAFRLEAAKGSVSGAGELALGSALAEYDRVLFDVYGLFAVSETDEELTENVVRYFRNTIENTGLLEESDSYVRSMLGMLYGSLSGGELPSDNLVKMSLSSFEIEAVEASSIANPTVLEKQIIEYMKYYGPVLMANGLITKLASLKDLAAQTVAAERKIEYETALCKTDKLDKEAFDALTVYLEASKKTGLPGKGTEIKGVLETTEGMLKLSVIMYLASGSNSIKPCRITASGGGDQTASGEDLYDGETAAGAPEALSGADLSEGKAILEALGMMKVNAASATVSNDIGSMKSLILNDLEFLLEYNRNASRLRELYPACLSVILKGTGGADNIRKETIDEAEKVMKLSVDVEKKARSAFDAIAVGAKSYLEAAADNIERNAYLPVKEEKAALEDAIDKLKRLREAASSLDENKEKWNDAIEALEDGDVKTGMKSDYSSSADKLDTVKLDTLIKALSADIERYERIIVRLEELELSGVRPVTGKAGIDSIDEALISLCSGRSFSDTSSLLNMADRMIDEEYNGKAKSVDSLFSGFSDISGNGAGSAFYRYLKKKYDARTGAVSGDSASASALKELLVSSAKKSSSSSAGETGDEKKKLSELAKGDVLKSIDKLYEDAGIISGTTGFTATLFDGDDDEALSGQAADSLGATSTLLSGIKNIGKTSSEAVFVEEYLTGMFSCATDRRSKSDGKAVAAISGADLTGNKCFGSEIEYILCGLDDLEANISSAKAMIFSVRFALNLLYVITDGESRAQTLAVAETIAGWTGFGAPLVQNVILAAWALAETGVDLNLLMKGDSVALYKSKTTWHLGFSGLKKTLVATAAEAAIEVSGDIFDAVSAYLSDKTAEGCDKLKTELNGYADSVLDNLYNTVCDMIAVPVSDLAFEISRASAGIGIDEITGKLEKIYDDAAASSGGLTSVCIKAAMKKLEQDKTGLASEIYKAVKSSSNAGATEALINSYLFGSDGEGGIIGSLKKKIGDAISEEIDKYGDVFKKETTELIESGSEELKSALAKKIGEFAAGIDSTSGSGGGLTVASGFGMTYKEYLKMFILLSYAGKSDEMLSRAAKLIQINLSAIKAGSGGDFDITKCYTMFVENAEINVKTAFLSVPVVAVSAGKARVIEFDFTKIGSGSQKLFYRGVLSY